MKHRHLTTENWSRMAIDSLFDRGKLADWKEFVSVLSTDRELAEQTLAVCKYHKNTGSVELALVFLTDFFSDLNLRY